MSSKNCTVNYCFKMFVIMKNCMNFPLCLMFFPCRNCIFVKEYTTSKCLALLIVLLFSPFFFFFFNYNTLWRCINKEKYCWLSKNFLCGISTHYNVKYCQKNLYLWRSVPKRIVTILYIWYPYELRAKN